MAVEQFQLKVISQNSIHISASEWSTAIQPHPQSKRFCLFSLFLAYFSFLIFSFFLLLPFFLFFFFFSLSFFLFLLFLLFVSSGGVFFPLLFLKGVLTPTLPLSFQQLLDKNCGLLFAEAKQGFINVPSLYRWLKTEQKLGPGSSSGLAQRVSQVGGWGWGGGIFKRVKAGEAGMGSCEWTWRGRGRWRGQWVWTRAERAWLVRQQDDPGRVVLSSILFITAPFYLQHKGATTLPEKEHTKFCANICWNIRN